MAHTLNGAPNHIARSIDFACILMAFVIASAIASLLSGIGLFTWPNVPAHSIKGWPTDYVILLIAALIIWAFVGAFYGLHTAERVESTNRAYLRLLRALALWIGVTLCSMFFLKLRIVSRQFNLSFFTIAVGLILLRQFSERMIAIRGAHGHRNRRRALVIGSERESDWLVEILSARPEWYGAVTRLTPAQANQTLSAAGHEGRMSVNSERAEVFILPDAGDHRTMEDWGLRFLKQGAIVHLVPAIVNTHLFRHNLGDIAGVPTLTLETGLSSHTEAAAKRAIDFIVSGVLLVLLAPIMGLVALIIKCDSLGPVIFTQRRLGKYGLPFTIFKFRTMKANAEEILQKDDTLRRKYLQNNFKLPDGEDLRVTRLGRLLRKTSLDELPQLINVFRGDMSLVGPRPIVPEELTRYGEYASLLLMTKPGMTGNWQVNGRSSIPQYSDRIKLDMEYLRDQSVAVDFNILLRTVRAVAKMDGAH